MDSVSKVCGPKQLLIVGANILVVLCEKKRSGGLRSSAAYVVAVAMV